MLEERPLVVVFAPESRVLLSVGWANAPIHARIRSVSYGPLGYLRYEVIYWDSDGARFQIWVDAFEVMPFTPDGHEVSERMDIGFRKQ